MNEAIIAAVRTSPQNVLQDYSRLFDLLNTSKVLDPGVKTILKLNLSWSKFFPACNTPPWQLDATVKYLLKNGFDVKKILAVENKTVVTNPARGLKRNAWDLILNKHKVKFERLDGVKWIPYKNKDKLSVLPSILPDLKIPALLPKSQVMHLATMKTHGHTTITGSVKNAFGSLLQQRRHHCHKHIHEVLVDILRIQKDIHPNVLGVLDGTVAGNGPGPRTLIPEEKNLILASFDNIALDSLSAKIMGFDPMKIGFLRMGHEAGLGCADLDEIRVVGDDVSSENWSFRVNKSPVIWGDQLVRKGGLRFLEGAMHTSLFQIPRLLSYFYHDVLWYNMVGKSRTGKFQKTDWGKLFKTYLEK